MEHADSSLPSTASFHHYSSSMASQAQHQHALAYADHRQPSPTPRTRSSTESSHTKASGVRRDSLQQPSPDAQDEIVPTTFDESALRVLIDMDGGVNCILDRIKQGMASAREAAVFLQKRGALEDELGRSMHKLAVATASAYAANECKAGTFSAAWDRSMQLHQTIADNRLKLAINLTEMSDQLSSLAKEIDRNRKTIKDTHSGYERTLLESEATTDKYRLRFEAAQDELERFLVAKEGENIKDARMQSSPQSSSSKRGPMGLGKAVVKGGGMLLKGKNPVALQRQEEEVRSRMASTSDAYRKAILDTQALRSEYFNFQLPRTLRALKELNDEIDTAMQFHLSRYAYLLESSLLSDAVTLVPKDEGDGPGLKSIMESIDNRADFKAFVSNYRVAHQGMKSRSKTRRAAGARLSTAIQNLASSRGADASGTFGVDLVEQMERDGGEIPRIVVKCCEAIEKYGLDMQGIYRVNGTQTKIQKLKELMNRDVDSVDLDADEWTSDINNVASLLKMWLRELPEPLMTNALYTGFIEAAKNDNERLRHIRIHERVNDLPDANYSTLKYLMGHLSKLVSCH
ncbi:related to GTPase-activating protein beta-chimerin [Serendipita indica DSM 11827]|uniref:Related to GTPase-activating protein beta-chimerin n=1 Tax=Serendipita indica (strain DSM 11827) TaxID=1109443 RepID=G4T818_SERID|nr:related to GTPase-activating protein beta-chimerin [Serendipita indica DSM 11827]